MDNINDSLNPIFQDENDNKCYFWDEVWVDKLVKKKRKKLVLNIIKPYRKDFRRRIENE